MDVSLEALRPRLSPGLPLSADMLAQAEVGEIITIRIALPPTFGGPTSVTPTRRVLALWLCVPGFRPGLLCAKGTRLAQIALNYKRGKKVRKIHLF